MATTSCGKLGLAGLTAVLMLGASVTATLAQTTGRIVTFGDSLSDNGNLPAGLAPPAPYLGGRFSNGITWTEIISGGSQGKPLSTFTTTGNVNLALGGSRSDNAANLSGPIPSIPTQIATFSALGGTYGSKDLVTLQGGANNIFQYFTAAGAGATQVGIVTAATTAATSLTGSAQTLASAGARRILVSNLPDIGASPQFNATATGVQSGSLASATFNDTLNSGIRALAAANPGTEFVQMDWSGLFKAVVKNASAFGFTNTTASCVATTACVTGSTATQNTYLFWDSVHPTAAGHRIIAQYASVLLAPQSTAANAAPIGEVGIRARQSAVDDVFDRTSGWARGQFTAQNGVYANVTGSFADVDAHGATPGYRVQLGGVRAGLDRKTGDVLVGGSAGVALGEIGGSALKADVNTYDADVYAAWLKGPLYVSGQAGVSLATFDTDRFVGVGPITATGTTRSLQSNAAAEAGVLAKFGATTVVPSARINYIHANVDSFDEKGDILKMSFESRTINAFFASARVKATTPVGIGLMDGAAFAEVGYERLLTSSGNSINASFIDNTAFAFSTSTGNPLARGFNAKVGVDGKIGDTTHVALSYGVALQDGSGVAHTGAGQIKVPF